MKGNTENKHKDNLPQIPQIFDLRLVRDLHDLDVVQRPADSDVYSGTLGVEIESPAHSV